ncbi:MAG: CPBP family intramembrane metalloprotease [Lachnospiraceae bacterium]|nr:CPBP family intramembrane metalloprotease [Lachnospiraceae bacterium]MCI9545974.1 CPBP family intramembrane metalloprotease [Lachnospiraceae bacterium]
MGYLVVQALVLALLVTGHGMEGMEKYSLAATGITGLMTIPIAGWLMKLDNRQGGFYRRGRFKRWLNPGEALWMLLLGMSICHLVNMLLSILQIARLFPGYGELSERVFSNQSFWPMLFWVGIVAPIAEELIFRGLIFRRLLDDMCLGWAIGISAFLFGAYHGNMMQFLYAGILGACFAYCYYRLDSLWAPVLLHMGANSWSVALTQLATKGAASIQLGYILLLIMGLEVAVLVFSIVIFCKK